MADETAGVDQVKKLIDEAAEKKAREALSEELVKEDANVVPPGWGLFQNTAQVQQVVYPSGIESRTVYPGGTVVLPLRLGRMMHAFTLVQSGDAPSAAKGKAK